MYFSLRELFHRVLTKKRVHSAFLTKYTHLYLLMYIILGLFYIIVVIQRIVEILRSLLLITMLVTTWLTSWTLTTTLMTIITTTATLTTLWTWTTLTLLIALWLLHQHTVRKLVLTSLRINLHQLHLDLVAFLDASLFNCLKTLPIDLRNMEQTILTWENLYEAPVSVMKKYTFPVPEYGCSSSMISRICSSE